MTEAAKRPRDIHERALEYAVRSIRLFRCLSKSRDVALEVVSKQYLRAATGIGANLAEMHAAETKADFVHKCSIAQKEARECLYWLRLMQEADLLPSERIRDLLSETSELIAVITTIGKNARNRS